MQVKNELSKILMVLNKLVEYNDIKSETDLIKVTSMLINHIDWLYCHDCIYETDCLKLADGENKDCNNCFYGYSSSIEFNLVELNQVGLPVGYMVGIIHDILKTEYSEQDLKYLNMYKLLELFCITDRLSLIKNTKGLDQLVLKNNISMQTVLNTALCQYLINNSWSSNYLKNYFECYWTLKDTSVTADCFNYGDDKIILIGDDISNIEVITDIENEIRNTTSNIVCFFEISCILRCLK